MKQKEYSMARALQQLLLHCSVVAVIAPAFGTAILFLLAQSEGVRRIGPATAEQG